MKGESVPEVQTEPNQERQTTFMKGVMIEKPIWF